MDQNVQRPTPRRREKTLFRGYVVNGTRLTRRHFRYEDVWEEYIQIWKTEQDFRRMYEAVSHCNTLPEVQEYFLFRKWPITYFALCMMWMELFMFQR